VAAAEQLGPLAELFEQAGYASLTRAGRTIRDGRQANAKPEVFAHKSVGQVADHFGEVIGELKRKPAVVGHSFGGLLTQIVAGRGLSAASVAIDPAPFRGVLPLPVSALKSARPVLGNPATAPRGPAHLRAVPLRLRQCRRRGRGQAAVFDLRRAGRRLPLFQAATANLNPWTEAKVNSRNPSAGHC